MDMQTICAKSNKKLASHDKHKNKFYNICNSRASMAQIYYYGICRVGKIATQYDFKKCKAYKLIFIHYYHYSYCSSTDQNLPDFSVKGKSLARNS